MPEQRTYIPTKLESSLWAWATAALPSGTKILFSNQGNVRVEKPFVTIQVLTDGAITDPEEEVIQNDDGSRTLRIFEQRQGTVQMTAFGSESWPLIRALGRSIRRQSINDLNRANGLEILQDLGANDVPEQMSTWTEPRRVNDFVFAYGECTEEPFDGQVIEATHVTGDVYQQNPGDGCDPDFVVTWPTP